MSIPKDKELLNKDTDQRDIYSDHLNIAQPLLIYSAIY